MEKFYRAALCTEEELKSGKYSYQKAKGKIKPSPKWERDEEGFFLPTTEGATRHYGLLCAALGTTPQNRKIDIEHWLENLTKEAYEHDIQGLMCRIRNTEYRMLYKYAAIDARDEHTKEKESGHGGDSDRGDASVSFKAENRRFKDTISGDRGKLIDSLTWEYKWVQVYKKPCFLFALHTIEDLQDWNAVKRLLRKLPEEEQEFILTSKDAFDSKKKVCVFDSEAKGKDEKLLHLRAGIYWREYERHMERERFREDFIHSYNKLPMANRRLMNTMYELAWDCISHYMYGKPFGHIPMPWYDKKEEATKDTEKVPDKAEGGI